MQTTLLTLGIVLILALVAALVGPLFVDWGRFRTDIEARASRIAGQPVRIAGNIHVRLLPTPTIRLQEIEVGPPADKPALGARGLDAELSLAALMRGEWRATVLRINAPHATLERDGAGRVLGPSFGAGDMTIDRVVVNEGRLSLADAGSGAQAVLDKLSFNGEIRGVGPIRGEGSFVAEGQSFSYRIATSRSAGEGIKLRLGIDPSDRPLTIETEGTLTLENDAPRYDGSLALARPAGLVLSSGKTITSEPWRIDAKLKIDSAVALFEQVEIQYGPDERAIRLAGTAELKLSANARLNGVLSARQVDLDRALAVTGMAGRLPIASLRRWMESIGDLPRPPLPVTLGVGIDSVTLGGATLQSMRADLRAERTTVIIDTLEFRAPGFAQVGLGGRLDTASGDFVGPVSLDVSDPKTLIAWLDGIELANRAVAPFRLRGDVAFGPGRIGFDRVKGEYDHKAFEGRLAYRFARAAEPARLDVALSAAEFDLDNAISLATTVAGGAGVTGATFERPGEIALVADLGRVRFAGVDAKASKVNVTFDRSGLRIDTLSVGDFGGAAINATGQIDALSGVPRGAVSFKLDAQRIDGLAELAARVSPKGAELLRANAARIAPAKFEAVLNVDPAPAAGKSVGRLKLEGNIGGLRASITGEGRGDMSALARADIRLDGRFASNDGALLTALGLDGLASEKGTAGLMFTARGSTGDDLKVDVKLSADGLDAAAAGTLRFADIDDVNGSAALTLSVADVRWLRREKPFSVTLQTAVAIRASDIAFSGLSGQAGGAHVRGQGNLRLGRPLGVDASVAADQIDLPAVIATAIGVSPQSTGSAAWSPQPFRAPAQIVGRITFDADMATLLPSMVAKKLRGVLSFTPQDIVFETVTASLGGGALSADAAFRSGTGGLSVRARVSLANADATALFRGSAQPPVGGRLSSKLELEGAGSNPAALIGSLNGNGSITLEGAQIAGLDPKAIDFAVRAFERGTPMAPARIGDIVGRVMDAGSLSMPWVSAPLAISAGRVRLGKLVAPPQSSDLAASGALDLVDATLDARLTVFGTAEAGQRPEASIVLKGPLATPRRTVDVSALVSWLTMQSVDREAKRLDAAERAAKQIDGAPSAPRSGNAPAATPSPSGSNVGASLAPAAEPQTAPTLPPPVNIARPPGASPPRSMPRIPAAPLLLTPQ